MLGNGWWCSSAQQREATAGYLLLKDEPPFVLPRADHSGLTFTLTHTPATLFTD
jgi:hypothetical protein